MVNVLVLYKVLYGGGWYLEYGVIIYFVLCVCNLFVELWCGFEGGVVFFWV